MIDAGKPVALDKFPDFVQNRCEAKNGDFEETSETTGKSFRLEFFPSW
jgi:hypothetical protein